MSISDLMPQAARESLIEACNRHPKDAVEQALKMMQEHPEKVVHVWAVWPEGPDELPECCPIGWMDYFMANGIRANFDEFIRLRAFKAQNDYSSPFVKWFDSCAFGFAMPLVKAVIEKHLEERIA